MKPTKEKKTYEYKIPTKEFMEHFNLKGKPTFYCSMSGDKKYILFQTEEEG